MILVNILFPARFKQCRLHSGYDYMVELTIAIYIVINPLSMPLPDKGQHIAINHTS